MLKRKTGITLVALVITMIILLILAGITISLVIGDNGILKNAEFAGKKYENKEEEEKNILAQVENYMINYRDTPTGETFLLNGTPIKTNATLDGKPIYAKYVTIDSTVAASNKVPHNISNIDKKWIDIGNTFMERNDDYVFALPSLASTFNACITDSIVWIEVPAQYAGYKVNVLVKYTIKD